MASFSTHLNQRPRIRVLGTSGAWLNGSEPCSSYLVQDDDTRILLDCGTGAVAALNQFVDPAQPLDAIILSHAHPDHCFDLVPLLYDHVFGLRQGQRPRLYLSAETRDRLNQLAAAFSDKEVFWDQAYDMKVFGEGDVFTEGKFTCSVRSLPHAITSWSSRIEHASGKVFVYSGDVGQEGIDALTEHAADADILLCEAGIPEILESDHSARSSHLDPRQAAYVAMDAMAQRLYLVHVPINYGPDQARKRAAEIFPMGAIYLPRSGDLLV